MKCATKVTAGTADKTCYCMCEEYVVALLYSYLICYIQISPRHKIAIFNLHLSTYMKVSLRKYLKLSLHLSSKNTSKYMINRIVQNSKNRSHLLELLSESLSKTYKDLLNAYCNVKYFLFSISSECLSIHLPLCYLFNI